MKLFKRILPLLLAVALLAALLYACGKKADDSAAPEGAATPEAVDIATVTDICTYLCGLPADTVVATVDDEPITAGTLMHWVISNCDNYFYYYQGMQELPWDTVIGGQDEDGNPDGEGKTFAQYVLDDSVKSAAAQLIIEKKAAAAGITIQPEDVAAIQTYLDDLVKEWAAKTDKVSFEQALWQDALTLDAYTLTCEREYLYQGLTDYYYGEGGENEPTDDILMSYLNDSGYYRVKHILLDTKEATDEEKAQKKAKIDDLLAQIKASSNREATFDKLMKEHSEDPGLATNPDGYTFQANTNIDPAFEEAALALEPGQLSEVVEGMHGYHIMLRLPMVATEELKQAFINENMSLTGTLWIEEAEIELTEAGKNLDTEAIYNAMQSYRYTITTLMDEE